MPQMSIKAGGSWHPVKTPWVKVGGQWKKAKKVYAKSGGQWKQVWQDFVGHYSMGVGLISADNYGTNLYSAGSAPVPNSYQGGGFTYIGVYKSGNTYNIAITLTPHKTASTFQTASGTVHLTNTTPSGLVNFKTDFSAKNQPAGSVAHKMYEEFKAANGGHITFNIS